MKNVFRYPLIFYCKIKTKSKISKNTIINKKTKLGGMNKINNANVSSSEIGFGTYILSGNFSNCLIGKFCSIGQNISIVDADHPIDYISSYPGFYQTINRDIFLVNSQTQIKEHRTCSNGKKVCIGNDVWIGNNVTIRGGVTISDGAVVGADALVLKDVPPYAIVGGVPAKILRYRFSNEIIEKLLKIKWWNWDIEKIKRESTLFSDVSSFVNKHF